MLTAGMSVAEVVREVMSDYRSLESWVQIQVGGIMAQLRRTKQLPVTFVKQWQSPRKNPWTVCFVCNPKLSRNPLQISWTTLVDDDGDLYTYHPQLTETGIDLIIYQPHFFVRYRERFLKDDRLKLRQVIHRYMVRNIKGYVQMDETDHTRWSGFVADGIIFGAYLDGNARLARTFITRDMAREGQLWNFGKGDIGYQNTPTSTERTASQTIAATIETERITTESEERHRRERQQKKRAKREQKKQKK